MEITWVKIDSWHAVNNDPQHIGHIRTMCGRFLGDWSEQDVREYSATLPAEKSCELCLRIVGRAADVEGAPV